MNIDKLLMDAVSIVDQLSTINDSSASKLTTMMNVGSDKLSVDTVVRKAELDRLINLGIELSGIGFKIIIAALTI